MEIAIIIIYGFFLFFIFLYSLVMFNLSVNYLRRKNKPGPSAAAMLNEFPMVTVQLPVYNELYVVERLIDAVCEMDYPTEKLEIQVLDDSNDESVQVAATKILEKKEGYNIFHVRRNERKGFKAGALAYGLEISRGEFIAIFDADFIPPKDFLRQTIPHLMQNESLGVVQTKWKHLNKHYSLLTRLQAFGLDAHFSVEQVGRNSADHFINFNGTGGVWRRKTIQDAGGWESDTLTEDLDLSYRAQMKGWKFLYLENFGAPAELPVDMNALKQQQFRWTKGAAECAVKNLPSLLRTKIRLSHKIHAVFHLLNSFLFVCIFCTAVLSIPMLFIKNSSAYYYWIFNLASLFLISFVILGFFYWISRPEKKFIHRLGIFLFEFPLFLSVSMGLSLHNSIAVVEGYSGKKSPFVRTPKFALRMYEGSWSDKKYKRVRVSPLVIIEVILAFYFMAGIVAAFNLGDFGLLPFHIMLATGFFIVSFYSIKHARS